MTANIILATLPRYPDAAQNTMFIIVGFLFVVAMLGALGGITAAVGLVFRRVQARTDKRTAAARAAQIAAEPAAPVPAAVTAGSEDNPHLLPLIAAAVHTVLRGQPHRIMNVRKKSDGWAQEGRRQIFSSHKVR